MPTYNRREFLATSALALAGPSLGFAKIRRVAWSDLRSVRAPSVFLPEIVDPEHLRALARVAIDAAQRAGASYADIRIATRRIFDMQYLAISGLPPDSRLGYDYSYGIRVRVNGAWAFAFGDDPTLAGVAQAANTASNTAKKSSAVTPEAHEWAPAPVATGEWSTPVHIDPFEVPPDEHAQMLRAYSDAAGRVPGGGISTSFYWTTETRVFASSEGSLITQRLNTARPGASVADWGVAKGPGFRQESITLPIPELTARSAGFEIAVGNALQEKIKVLAEDAAKMVSYPVGSLDVGRYEAVFDGTSLATAAGATLLPALELDRVLGRDVDQEGSSYLAPVDEILGQPIFAPALHMTADRSLPHFGAAKWDDEGVVTEAFSVIQAGAVVDYFGTRETTPRLARWYQTKGQAATPHGTAITWLPSRMPIGAGACVQLQPASSGLSLDDLVRQVSNGILVRGVQHMESDQQLMNTLISDLPMLFEVKKGQITRRVQWGNGLQFNAPKFWKRLTSIGGASSVEAKVHQDVRGQPAMPSTQMISAPAAHVDSVDVINLQRRF